jgi:hypothetical protein
MKTGALPSSHEGLNAEKWEVNLLENTVQKLTKFFAWWLFIRGGGSDGESPWPACNPALWKLLYRLVQKDSSSAFI